MFSGVNQHVIYRVANTPLNEYPYPHIYVRDIFPPDYYRALREHLPPAEFLATLKSLKRVRGAYPDSRVVLPLTPDNVAALPEPYRAFWEALGTWLLSGSFAEAVMQKFGPYLKQRFQGMSEVQFFNEALVVKDSTTYSLGPHTDTPAKVLSFLFYLPADESMAHLGTSIYVPKKQDFRCTGEMHHEFDQFERVVTLPYVPNSLFAFLKTHNSFHGVEPIADAGIKRDLLLYDIKVTNPPELQQRPARPETAAAPAVSRFSL